MGAKPRARNSRRRLLSVGSAALAWLWLAALPVVDRAQGGESATGLRSASAALARAEAPTSELHLGRVIDVPGGARIMRYSQRVDGRPVLGSETIVVAERGRAPRLQSDDSVASLSPRRSPRVGRERALDLARVSTGLADADRETARLAIARRHDGTLVWDLRLFSASPLRDLSVLVNAATGRVIEARSTLRQAGAIQARLFDVNAVMSNDGYSGLADASDSDSGRLTALRRTVTLGNLNNSRGCLTGRWVTVRLGPSHESVCRSSGDYRSVKRGDDRFEGLMSYFFVDRAQRYVQSLALGEPINQRRQVVDADAITEDNSYYDSANRRMTLGTGGVDDAEDGDVITHEYGHALQDDQVRDFGVNFAGAAMGEGFGDYFAAALSLERSPQPASPSKDWNQCIFEWDAISYTNQMCGRRTTLKFTLPQAMAEADHDEHIVGEAWSGALWTLRGQIGDDDAGRAVIDRVVLESHFLLTKSPSYWEGAKALIDADQLLYAGAHCQAIATELIRRKFFTSQRPAPAC